MTRNQNKEGGDAALRSGASLMGELCRCYKLLLGKFSLG